MIIHNVEKTGDRVFALTQSASSGGGRYGQPVTLRLCQIEPAVFDAGLDGKDLTRTKGVKVLREIFADSKHQGPNSHFGKTMESLKASLTAHAAKVDPVVQQSPEPTVNPVPENRKPSRGMRL